MVAKLGKKASAGNKEKQTDKETTERQRDRETNTPNIHTLTKRANDICRARKISIFYAHFTKIENCIN